MKCQKYCVWRNQLPSQLVLEEPRFWRNAKPITMSPMLYSKSFAQGICCLVSRAREEAERPASRPLLKCDWQSMQQSHIAADKKSSLGLPRYPELKSLLCQKKVRQSKVSLILDISFPHEEIANSKLHKAKCQEAWQKVAKKLIKFSQQWGDKNQSQDTLRRKGPEK